VQRVKVKEDFPPDGRKIGKSVAAMATAGGGLILIGVRNDGTVAGLNENEVDRLCLRAHAIAEEVRPAAEHKVTPCYDKGFIIGLETGTFWFCNGVSSSRSATNHGPRRIRASKPACSK
jgi:hypothetical protein